VLRSAHAESAAYDAGSEDLMTRITAGLERAASALESGAAAALLERWVLVSQELRPS